MEILTPPEVREKRPPGRRPKYSVSYMKMVAVKFVEEGMSYREAGKNIRAFARIDFESCKELQKWKFQEKAERRRE
ncbi:MAG: hypothetical protein EOP06_14470 [Proteobacteria bacterium]|nr:MAG: hypothetical protein EOP06_14470 [Pseudomonadota bacterium]